jgi:hypothetical protein
MTTKEERPLTEVLHGMVTERQRSLNREPNYLRGLVGLPPVGAESDRGGEATIRDVSSSGGDDWRGGPCG